MRDLKYFLATVEAGSLSMAAQRCFVTQPALSKSIARIERVISQKIFLRSRKGMSLTSAGEMFYSHAIRVCREYDEVVNYAQNSRKGMAGLLRIGATRPVFETVLQQAVTSLVQEAPQVCLELELGAADDLLEQLEAGRLDMLLAPLKSVATPGIVSQALGFDTVCVIAREDHPVFALEAPGLARLAQFHWILPGRSAAALQWFRQSFHKAGLTAPRATLEINYAGLSILETIAQTDLLAYLPGRWNVEVPAGLSRLYMPELDSSRIIYLATRKGASWTPIMKRMHEILISKAGTTFADDAQTHTH